MAGDRPLVAVLLAGGTGTRLYPASRPDRPKQFLPLGDPEADGLSGGRSLLSRTADRVGFADETYVLTRPRYADAVREHVPDAAVLAEPEPKDTGPALAYAAARVRDQVGDCVLLCLPSDHRVAGDFRSTAERAARVASETGDLVTLGVEPTRPATGYGYITPGAERDGYSEVAAFREKPDRGTARDLVDRGALWNAGMFAWTPGAFLSAAADSPLAPLVETLDAGGDAADAFDAVDPVSVDYAVLERADDVHVVPAEFEWDDVGSWDAVGRLLAGVDRGGDDAAATANDPGESGDSNAVLGDGTVLDGSDNVVVGEDAHVSVVGADGLAAVAVDGRVLVVPREHAQRVRDLVDVLDADGEDGTNEDDD